jgi:phenylpyruvate tautomerase PptA (4-oxalocrotonate tautomerase family)
MCDTVPMLDVYLPDGTLDPVAEAALIERITTILVTHEGFDPRDPATLAASWAFVHRVAEIYVGGARAAEPRYKIVVSVPEGQLDAAARAQVISEVTDAVLHAEAGRWAPDKRRVWVFPIEIPEGHWGSGGDVVPLATILRRITGSDEERARRLAHDRITASRKARALVSG